MRIILIVIFLAAIVIVSFFVANSLLPAKPTSASSPPLYVGIEIGWASNVTECKELIDTVRSYTNLLIIASPLILSDEALLNQVCDYAYKSGMYFMPHFNNLSNSTLYLGVGGYYLPSTWFTKAKELYGDKLLGVYFYDEAGGFQLDQTNTTYRSPTPISSPNSYRDNATNFRWLWTHGGGVPAVANFTHSLNSITLTSDYALYWFDYQVGWDTVLTQFGWNNSRQLQISLDRGAANAYGKDWGAIITWTYNNGQMPYLEPAPQLYDDMVLAYDSGAKYIAIYDSSHNFTTTTLNKDYFEKLRDFWNYIHDNPEKQGSLEADAAAVVASDYGFGFRSINDSVWQIHEVDSWTPNLYKDVTKLIWQYNSSIDIVYNDLQFQNTIQSKYRKVLYWPNDFEAMDNYPIIDLNNSLGYRNIQEAISSYATYQGDTLLVKPTMYQENFYATKAVIVSSQNNNTITIGDSGNRVNLKITKGQITVSH